MHKVRQLILVTMLMGSASVVLGQSPEALNVHSADGSVVKSTLLDNFRKITFSGNTLLLWTQNETCSSFPLNSIRKITFGEYVPNSIADVKRDLNIKVYANLQGEIIVETSYNLLGIHVFDINGRVLRTTTENRFNIGYLPSGIYLIHIKTDKGSITQKIINH